MSAGRKPRNGWTRPCANRGAARAHGTEEAGRDCARGRVPDLTMAEAAMTARWRQASEKGVPARADGPGRPISDGSPKGGFALALHAFCRIWETRAGSGRVDTAARTWRQAASRLPEATARSSCGTPGPRWRTPKRRRAHSSAYSRQWRVCYEPAAPIHHSCAGCCRRSRDHRRHEQPGPQAAKSRCSRGRTLMPRSLRYRASAGRRVSTTLSTMGDG